MKLIKRLLLIVVLLPIALLAIAAVLVFTIDPNRLKPVLEDLAAQQGMQLTIDGEIGWQFYPNIGIGFTDVQLSSLDGEYPLARGEEASVSVQLMPLFKRKILVDGIVLKGLSASYEVAEDGTSNWAAVLDTSTPDAQSPTEPEAPTTDGQLPELAIAKLTIENLSLAYRNRQTGEQAALSDLNLTTADFALDGRNFPIDLNFQAQVADLPAIGARLSGPVSLNLDTQQLAVTNSQLALTTRDANLQATVTTQTQWGEQLVSSGRLSVPPFNAHEWLEALAIQAPETQNPKALNRVGFTTEYRFNPDAFSLTDTRIQLDDTELAGDLGVANFAQPVITSQWRGDVINVDDYLPPVTDETESPANETAEEPLPLPVDLLRTLSLDVNFAMERITAMDLEIGAPKIHLSGSEGLFRLENLSAHLAEGSIEGKGAFDVRPPQPELALAINTQGVQLAPLLKQFADVDMITGSASAKVALTSTGATDQALLNNLVIEAEAASEQLQLTPFNLTQQFCRAVSLLQQQQLPAYDWPNRTQLEPVTMAINFANESVQLKDFNAEIAKLLGAAQGQLNLATGDFDFPLQLSLGNFAAGEDDIDGCLPIEEKWRNRALPIRCKGNLNSIGVKTCLPDTDLLMNLAKEKVKAEVDRELEKQKDDLEENLKEKAQDLLKDKLGEEKAQETEDQLRDLLNQFKAKKR